MFTCGVEMGCGTSKTLQVNADLKEADIVKQVHIEEDDGRELETSSKEFISKDESDENVHLTKLEDDTSNAPIQQQKEFALGDRVHMRGYVGIVKFVGTTELGEGEWLGMEMD